MSSGEPSFSAIKIHPGTAGLKTAVGAHSESFSPQGKHLAPNHTTLGLQKTIYLMSDPFKSMTPVSLLIPIICGFQQANIQRVSSVHG